MKAIKQTLTDAIKQKTKITLQYKDEHKTRTVYPHILYTNAKDHIILDAYQVEGYSSSGSRFPQWKQFLVQDIHKVVVLDETFQPLDSFNADSPRYQKTIIKI